MSDDRCDGCGMCCMHLNTPPFTIGDGERLRAERPDLADAIDAYVDSPRYGDSEWPCMWLDRGAGRCMHYEHRPDVCREYEVAGVDCHLQRLSVALTIEGWPLRLEREDRDQPNWFLGGAAREYVRRWKGPVELIDGEDPDGE